MEKFSKLSESTVNSDVSIIKEILIPMEDHGYDIKIIHSRYYRTDFIDAHRNFGILSGDNPENLNSYAVVISRKRKGVIRNSQHGIGLYSIQNEMPVIDISPQEMMDVMGDFLSSVNRIKDEFDCDWSICGPDQFIIIVLKNEENKKI